MLKGSNLANIKMATIDEIHYDNLMSTIVLPGNQYFQMSIIILTVVCINQTTTLGKSMHIKPNTCTKVNISINII